MTFLSQIIGLDGTVLSLPAQDTTPVMDVKEQRQGSQKPTVMMSSCEICSKNVQGCSKAGTGAIIVKEQPISTIVQLKRRDKDGLTRLEKIADV